MYVNGWKKAEERNPSYNSYLLEHIKFEKVQMDSEKSPSGTASEFTAIFSFPVLSKYANLYGTLHGGVIASLVDVISTIPIAIVDKTHRGGVSSDLQVSYVNAARIGETVLIEASCTKAGKSLAFSHTRLRERESGRLVATASHTKFMDVKVKKVMGEEGSKKAKL